MTTSRRLVYDTLDFNRPERVPRNLWLLPWAANHYPGELDRIRSTYPDDFGGVDPGYCEIAPTSGNAYAEGVYVDEWGCRFQNRAEGIIGEVKEPIVAAEDENWSDLSRVHIPTELLTIDRDLINAQCRRTDKFVTGGCCPRPFERLQFIRGTEQLYVDLMLRPSGMIDFLRKMHTFYCDLLTLWAETEVDALNFMDDWGAQSSLLINPDVWVELFKPMYRDYIDIAHSHGKKILMHSDGHILAIYPHLIELGLDAVNSQIFCMGVEDLAHFGGQITFWGEIDRQHLLPNATPAEIEQAVRSVHSTLWRDGGCIGQCEFGPGARPENVEAVFRAWDACGNR
jgi:hypothetical protein